MTQPRLIVMDDARGEFGPLTDLRAGFELRTGALTTLQRIESSLGRPAQGLWLRDTTLRAVVTERHDIPINDLSGDDDCLLVNGRWLGLIAAKRIAGLQRGSAMIWQDDIVAACLPTDMARGVAEGQPLPADVNIQRCEASPLIARPWHILDQLEATLAHDLTLTHHPRINTAPPACHRIGDHALHLSPSAQVQPGVVFNLQLGSVVIDDDALIGAGSVIEGPCYIGAHTQLAAHTYLRPHTVIGPQCKVAGEISFSIIHGFSNKAHFGYLGHSLVGCFVNLGAGTTVSNLKNTYGHVRVALRHDAKAQDTGRTFCGPIIGDFVRTAIGSRLLTGSCIATWSMLALSSFAPKITRPLAFHTDAAAEGEPARMDKFIATVHAMMARRKVELTPALEARLVALAG